MAQLLFVSAYEHQHDLGITTYGDYSEIRSNELAPILAATPDLSDVQIPMGIEYVLLDKNYQVIETTLDEDELEHAMRYATTGVIDQNLKKDTCLSLVRMSMLSCNTYIGAQYTNEWIEYAFAVSRYIADYFDCSGRNFCLSVLDNQIC